MRGFYVALGSRWYKELQESKRDKISGKISNLRVEVSMLWRRKKEDLATYLICGMREKIQR